MKTIKTLTVLLCALAVGTAFCGCSSNESSKKAVSGTDTAALAAEDTENNTDAPSEITGKNSEPSEKYSMTAIAEGKEINLTKEQQDEIIDLCVQQLVYDKALDSVYMEDSMYQLQGICIKVRLNSPYQKTDSDAEQRFNKFGSLTFVAMQKYAQVVSGGVYAADTDTAQKICSILGYEFDPESGLVTKNQPEFEPSSQMPYISGSDLAGITPEMTYADIISRLKPGANFGFEDRMLYILDNEKILVLRYNNSGDICGKTGEELAASAVSRLVPEDVQDKVFNESHWYYGFLMDEHSFFTESHGGPQIIMVSFGRTESIKNPDGSLADMRDLYMGSQYTNVLLEIDEVLESYPLQAYPKNVVVY